MRQGGQGLAAEKRQVTAGHGIRPGEHRRPRGREGTHPGHISHFAQSSAEPKGPCRGAAGYSCGTGGSGPWVRADAGQTRSCCARDRAAAGSSLPPPPDDPLPDGQVKGTLRVSPRDRCATPDMPVRSQDRQLSGSGRKRGRRCRLRARDCTGSPGLQDRSVRR